MAARALHIILAITVLLSSGGFVLNKHYCGGELKNTALFIHAPGCHTESQTKPACPLHGRQKNNCCNDESEYVKLDQDQQVTPSAWKLLKTPVPAPPVLVSTAPASAASNVEFLRYLTYRPPIVCDDFPSRLQTFRL